MNIRLSKPERCSRIGNTQRMRCSQPQTISEFARPFSTHQIVTVVKELPTILPLLGERAGVRASVSANCILTAKKVFQPPFPITFHVSRFTHLSSVVLLTKEDHAPI